MAIGYLDLKWWHTSSTLSIVSSERVPNLLRRKQSPLPDLTTLQSNAGATYFRMRIWLCPIIIAANPTGRGWVTSNASSSLLAALSTSLDLYWFSKPTTVHSLRTFSSCKHDPVYYTHPAIERFNWTNLGSSTNQMKMKTARSEEGWKHLFRSSCLRLPSLASQFFPCDLHHTQDRCVGRSSALVTAPSQEHCLWLLRCNAPFRPIFGVTSLAALRESSRLLVLKTLPMKTERSLKTHASSSSVDNASVPLRPLSAHVVYSCCFSPCLATLRRS